MDIDGFTSSSQSYQLTIAISCHCRWDLPSWSPWHCQGWAEAQWRV